MNKIISTDLLKLNINLLNGKSYAAWKRNLKALWIRYELWGIVKKPRPKEVTNEWKKSNNKAVAFTTLSLEDSQLLTHIVTHMDYANGI